MKCCTRNILGGRYYEKFPAIQDLDPLFWGSAIMKRLRAGPVFLMVFEVKFLVWDLVPKP